MQVGMVDRQAIRRRWEAVGSKLDERGRRMFAAGEALVAGWGGLEAVSEITGLARSTIGRGKKELDAAPLPKGRVRRDGAGRPDLSSRDATLVEDLLGVIEPVTLGDPVRPMLWVSKSHEKLADALQKKGHEVSASSVKRLLPTLGYSRQSNRKADEGSKHPDRNAQFAVASIRRWLGVMGRERYPDARELTITADGGGSNGSRVRLWKVELQKFADTTGLVLHVHHYPPGTSKWNKIEHRMFCHITQNWRARPLTDRLAVVELIAANTTKTGLKVESALDTATYEKGIKVSDAEMKTLDIQGDAFHPEWNYTIRPRLIGAVILANVLRPTL